MYNGTLNGHLDMTVTSELQSYFDRTDLNSVYLCLDAATCPVQVISFHLRKQSSLESGLISTSLNHGRCFMRT